MKITIAPEAVADCADAIEYVRERNPAASARLHERIHALIFELADAENFAPTEMPARREHRATRSAPFG